MNPNNIPIGKRRKPLGRGEPLRGGNLGSSRGSRRLNSQALGGSHNPSDPTNHVKSAPQVPRASFKLRKAIIPKHALSLLTELTSSSQQKPRFEFYDIPEVERERRASFNDIRIDQVGNFDCICILGPDQYIGEGPTKNDARNSAAEAAIQGEIVNRCELNYENRKPSEDHCPWGVIASLALFKMYEAWKLQGYSIPKELQYVTTEDTLKRSNTSTWMDKDTGGRPALAIFNEKVLQSNHTHEFSQVEEIGQPNDKNFTFRLSIGDQWSYLGTGKSKKAAKNNAAVLALKESDIWFKPKRRWQEEDYDEVEEESEIVEIEGKYERKEQNGKEQDEKEQDGKEQNGNEQDGKEQDGKEQDGKEKDGKEQDGKEQDGKELDEHEMEI